MYVSYLLWHHLRALPTFTIKTTITTLCPNVWNRASSHRRSTYVLKFEHRNQRASSFWKWMDLHWYPRWTVGWTSALCNQKRIISRYLKHISPCRWDLIGENNRKWIMNSHRVVGMGWLAVELTEIVWAFTNATNPSIALVKSDHPVLIIDNSQSELREHRMTRDAECQGTQRRHSKVYICVFFFPARWTGDFLQNFPV